MKTQNIAPFGETPEIKMTGLENMFVSAMLDIHEQLVLVSVAHVGGELGAGSNLLAWDQLELQIPQELYSNDLGLKDRHVLSPVHFHDSARAAFCVSVCVRGVFFACLQPTI